MIASLQKTSPTVLLVNAHSLCNAGDAALLEITISQLRAAFDHPRLLVSSNHPGESQLARLGVEPLPSPEALLNLAKRNNENILSGYRRLLAAYRQADLVASLPGNQFFSMGRFGRPLLTSAISIWLAIRYGKPLYILPQSLGPFHRRWEERLVRALYRRARLVCVREQRSYRLAQAWGLSPQKLILASDPAFDFPPCEPEQAMAILNRWGCPDGKPLLGITVIPSMTHTLSKPVMQAYTKNLAAALGNLSAHWGLHPVFFAQSTGPTPAEDDRLAARRVIELLPTPTQATLVDEVLAPAQLKACYGKMDAFIASRLHSGIFALGMAVPTLFIGYLTKTAALLETLAWLDWFIQLEEAGEELLTEKMTALWKERHERQEIIRARLPELSNGCDAAVQLIADALNFQEIDPHETIR
jgi:colanic acid/amylovoran biosynthesis protein